MHYFCNICSPGQTACLRTKVKLHVFFLLVYNRCFDPAHLLRRLIWSPVFLNTRHLQELLLWKHVPITFSMNFEILGKWLFLLFYFILRIFCRLIATLFIFLVLDCLTGESFRLFSTTPKMVRFFQLSAYCGTYIYDYGLGYKKLNYPHEHELSVELGIQPHLNQILIPPHAAGTGTNTQTQENSGGNGGGSSATDLIASSEAATASNPDSTPSQPNP